MSRATPITVTIPRAVADEMPALSRTLTDRMHDLLERNTDGSLSEIEQAELNTLVHMAHFAQLWAAAIEGAITP